MSSFRVRLASFGGLVSEPHIIFHKSRNWLNDHNGPGTINYERTLPEIWRNVSWRPHSTNTNCGEN